MFELPYSRTFRRLTERLRYVGCWIKAKNAPRQRPAGIRFEPLEPRVLFSASPAPERLEYAADAVIVQQEQAAPQSTTDANDLAYSPASLELFPGAPAAALVAGKDLVVSNVAGIPATVTVGQTLTVTFTVTNNGDQTVTESHDDEIFLSPDAIGSFASGDRELSFATRNASVAPGASYNVSRTFTVSASQGGAQFIVVVADGFQNRVAEADENNNSVAVPVNVVFPDVDLVAENASAPATAAIGETIPISFDIRNAGSVATTASSFRAAIYLSTNTTFESASDRFLGFLDRTTPLAAGATFDADFNLKMLDGEGGDYFLLFRADANGNQAETNETNNMVTRPITLTPAVADLAISDLQIPGTGFQGGTIQVSYKVTNNGPQAATGNWSDRINLIDSFSQTELATVPVGSNAPLAPGASYTVTRAVVIPPNASTGQLSISVITDIGNTLAETSSANNGTSKVITISQGNLPDLQVTSASINPNGPLVHGSTVAVTWTVKNNGTAAANLNGNDGIYLSADNVLSFTADTFLAFPNVSGTIAAGQSQTFTANVTIKGPFSGAANLIIATDDFQNVSELNESNNTFVLPVSVTVPQVDLVIVNPTAPTTAFVSEVIPVTFTVKNNGTEEATGSWFDSVYISDDAIYDSLDSQQTSFFSESTLAGNGGTYVQNSTVRLSDSLTPGAKFLIFRANYEARQGETNYGNNDVAVPITIQASTVDLRVSNVIAPASAAAGTSVPITYTVTNHGTTAATATWSDQVAILNGFSSVAFGSFDQSARVPLAPGASYTFTANLNIPSNATLGARMMEIETDWIRTQHESNNDNNTVTQAIEITEGASADLIVTASTVQASAISGESVDVSFTVRNDGFGATDFSWSDRVYLSSDATFGGDDIFLQVFGPRTALAAGGEYIVNGSVVIPSGRSGTQYLIFVADGTETEPELEETNNTRSHAISISGPDYVLSGASGPANAALGQTISLNYTVANQGAVAGTGTLSDTFYLSTDNVLDALDVVITTGANGLSSLPIGPGQAVSASVTLPSGPIGNVFLLIKANTSGQLEADTSNNVVAIPISLTGADLQVTAASGPATAAIGQTVSLTWTTKNLGNAPALANGWIDGVWLSEDQTIGGAGDVFVGSHQISNTSGLAVNGEITTTQSFEIPGGATVGARFLIIQANAFPGGQAEQNSANNTFAVPIQITAPNLVVTSINAPATARIGETISVSWTVTNQGAQPAILPYSDAVYLSTDGVIDFALDDFLGSEFRANATPLAPGASYTVTRDVTIVQTATGTRQLLVKADAFHDSGETNELDNVLARTIEILAPNLTVQNVVAPAQLTTGQTFTVTWDLRNQGGAALTANFNERIVVRNVTTGATIVTQNVSYLGTGAGNIAPGGLVSRSAQVTLPNGATGVGPLEITVLTDVFQEISEGTNHEGDNSGLTTATGILAPYADLVVANLSVPANLQSGQQITVQWNLRNDGNAPTSGDFNETLRVENLTTGQVLTFPNVPYVEATAGNGAILAGGTRARSATITLPDGPAGVGQLRFTVTTDTGDAIFEYNASGTQQANNVAVLEAPSTLAPYADLQISNLNAPAQPATGQQVTITWNTTNTGSGPTTASFTERVTIVNTTTGQTLATGFPVYDHALNGAIAAGGSAARQFTFTLADGNPGIGNLAITVATDISNQIKEFTAAGQADGNNEATITRTSVLGTYPDLQVTQVTPPVGVSSGQQATVTWVVKNAGTKATPVSWTDRVVVRHVATNTVIFDSAVPYDIAASGNAPLAPNGTLNRQVTFTLPDSNLGAGNLSYTVTTDAGNTLLELTGSGTGETNNETTATGTSALSQYADLVVSSISAPAGVISGNQLTVNWTIANNGNKAATGPFVDRVYLSADGALSEGDLFLGSFTFNGTIGVGATVNRVQDFTLPLEFSGTYKVIVVTDAVDSVLEFTAAGDANGNNTGVDDANVVVTLAPAPNLRVTSVTAPPTGASGQQAQVAWTVNNNGQTSTSNPFWSDSVFISLDQTLDSEDIFLGSTSNVSFLDVGQSYNSSLSVTIPNGYNGPFFFIVATDARPINGGQGFTGNLVGQVRETNNNDNVRAATTATQVALTPPPDLQVTTVNAPLRAFSGQTAAVSYTVTNTGPGRTPIGTWLDRVFLSTDDTLGAGDLQLAQLTHAPTLVRTTVTGGGSSEALVGGFLEPGESYTASATVTLPEGQSGDYFFIVQTDATNALYENTGEANNVGFDTPATQVVLTPPPDLTVTAVTMPATGIGSRSFSVTYTVTNAGSSRTPQSGWSDEIFLSADATLDGTDARFAISGPPGSLAAGESYTNTASFTLPDGFTGSYYAFVATDTGNGVFELNNANNSGGSATFATFTSTPADLLLVSPTVTATAQSGGTARVSFTVINVGVGDTVIGSWSDSIILSTDNVLGNGDDRSLGSFGHSGVLAPGASYFVSQLVDIPLELASGSYNVFVVADGSGQVFEPNAETNNRGPALPLTLTQTTSDLVVTSVATPANLGTRDTLTVNWTVQNTGANATNLNSVLDEVFLSPTPTLTDQSFSLGSVFHSGAVAAGASYNATGTFTLPIELSGTYYVLVVTNRAPRFYSANFEVGAAADNNLRASAGAFTITPSSVADLVVDSVTAPAEIISGQRFNLSYTVRNQGTATFASETSWTDYVYASRDGVFDPENDRFIGGVARTGGLAAGGTYTQNATLEMPAGLSGSYTFFVVTDGGNRVLERSNEGNNVRMAAAATNVTLPLPADLVAGTITIPANGTAGQSTTITYSVSNNGANPARGNWEDTVYLSHDGEFDLGDVLFGRFFHTGDVAAGGNYSGTVTASIPGLAPGDYQVLIRSDIRNQVVESNEANNFKATLNAVALAVQPLTLGTEQRGLISKDVAQYYRVEVAAGEALLFHFDGANNANLNQLYVSFGEVPTRSDFDFRGEASGADQDIIIPVTQAGTYYVLAYGVTGQALPANDYGLTASIIPFGVRSVGPATVGNAGSSTIELIGARFDSNTTFQLVGPGGEVLNATRVVPIDASHVYATFNLTGKTVGAYDVRATAGNGAVATLNDGLTVNVGIGANIVASLNGPQNVLINRNAPFFIDYANLGDADASVPVFLLKNVTGTPVGFELDDLTVPASTGDLQIVAVDDDALGGTLRPGERRQIPVFFFVPNGNRIEFQLTTITEQDTRLIDYTAIEGALRSHGLIPDTIASSGPEFDAAFARLKTLIGPTYGDYVRMLGRNADVLPAAFGSGRSALPMLRLEFLRAIAATGPSISGRLTTSDPTVATGERFISARNTATKEVFGAISLTDGTYTFERVTPGNYEITVERALVTAGGTPTVAANQSLTNVNTALALGSTITGRVLGSGSGQLVTGGVVTLTSPATGRSFVTTVAENGVYNFSGLPAGTYVMRAEADGRARSAAQQVVIATAQETVTRDFSLVPEAVLRGTLVAQAGSESAVAGALETLEIVAIDVANPANRFTAESDGLTFSVDHLPAGNYRVEIAIDGFVSTSVTATVAAGQTQNLASVILARAGSIGGTVVSTDPNVTAGYGLVGLYDGSDALLSIQQSDSLGGYAFTNLQPGTYTLRPIVEGSYPEAKTFTVTAGQELSQNLRILPGGTVAGTVIGSIGAGAARVLEGVRVLLTLPDGSRLSTYTDAAGNYRFTGRGLGAHTVSLATGALAVPASVTVATLDGTEVRTNLTASAAAQLGGRLLAANGAGVAGSISLYENGELVSATTTDADGNYSFLLLRGGTFALEAAASGVTFAPAANVVVAAGAAITRDFAAGSGAVQITVSDPSVAGTSVFLTFLSGLSNPLVGVREVDAAGVVSFAGLQPGTYEIEALNPNDRSAKMTVTVAASGVTNATVTTAADARFSGSVTAAGGAALAGASVTLISNADPNVRFVAATDAQGNFRITHIPNGSYSLAAAKDGYDAVIQSSVVVANGTGQAALTLSVATTTITGRIVDPQGKPVISGGISIANAAGHVLGSGSVKADGTFTIKGAVGQDLILNVQANGYGVLVISNVDVAAGATVALGDRILAAVAVPAAGSPGAAAAAPSVAALSLQLAQLRATLTTMANEAAAFQAPPISAALSLSPSAIGFLETIRTLAFGRFKDSKEVTMQMLFDADNSVSRECRLEAITEFIRADEAIKAQQEFYKQIGTEAATLRGELAGLAIIPIRTLLTTAGKLAGLGLAVIGAVELAIGSIAAGTIAGITIGASEGLVALAALAAGLTDAALGLKGSIDNVADGVLSASTESDPSAALSKYTTVSDGINALAGLALGASETVARVLSKAEVVGKIGVAGVGAGLIGFLSGLPGLLSSIGADFTSGIETLQDLVPAFQRTKTAIANYNESVITANRRLDEFIAKLRAGKCDPDDPRTDPDTIPDPGPDAPDDGVPNPPGGPGGPGGPGSPGGPGPGGTYTPSPRASRDPNDILGPEGFGDQKFVSVNDTLGYTIRFENAADATAPAQRVTITQQLDADLDFRTFRLDDFGFGDLRFELPGTDSFYAAQFDYSADRGYILDVFAFIDVETGVASWTLTALDPATGAQSDDPDVGFLPPDDATGRGEGFVSYTIRSSAAALTGARVDAEATIIFDDNAPINTPAIFNTIDASAPTSGVNALPANSGNPEFLVSWQGTDPSGSALASFDVYVSENGGAAKLFLAQTELRSATFRGETGNTYRFFTVARDNSGNLQQVGTIASVTTTVTGIGNTAPTVEADRTLTINEDAATTALGITAPTDADLDTLIISVTAVPDAAKGVFRKADGTAVAAGNLLTIAQLTGLTFTPLANVNGPAGAFSYTVNDGRGDSVSQTVTIDIASVNDLPVLQAGKTITRDEDSAAVALGITAPTDIDSFPLTISVTAVPTGGVIRRADNSLVTVGATLTLGELAALVFVPNLNANGPAGAFTYSVDDGDGGIVSRTVSFSLNPINDAPLAQASKTVTVLEDAAATNLGITVPTDVDGDVLNFTVTALPDSAKGQLMLANGAALTANQTLSVTELAGIVFVPVANANGAAGAFSYTVNDGQGGSAAQTVTLAITAVNDVPVVQADKTITVLEDATATALGITAPADIENDTLTITVTGLPTAAKGAVQLANGTAVANGATLTLTQLAGLTFTPAANANGAAGAFSYSVNDGNGGVVTQTITLAITPVNDAPVVAANKTLTVLEDAAATSLGLTAPTDVDADVLTITVTAIADPAKGQVRLANGTPVANGATLTAAQLAGLVFVPVANANGTGGVFSYSVTDGNGGSASQAVTLAITPVNDAPVAQASKTLTFTEDDPLGNRPLDIPVPTDLDGDTLTATVTTLPDAAKGVVRFEGGAALTLGQTLTAAQLAQLVFTPAANANGAAGAFAYSLSDGNGGTASQTVAINLTPVNDAPVAGANTTLTVLEDAAATSLGLTTPTDVDGDALTITVTSVADPAKGEVRLANGTVVANGATLTSAQVASLVFVPNSNAHGPAGAFSYSVVDGNGGTAQQTITLAITSVNEAPIVQADKTVIVPLGSSSAPLGIAAPTDADGDPLTITVTQLPTSGSILKADNTAVTAGAVLTLEELQNLRFEAAANNVTAAGAFRYQVSDGTVEIAQTITLTVVVREQIALGKKAVVITTAEGEKITIKLSAGSGFLTLVNGLRDGGDIAAINLTGTSSRTTLSVTVSRNGTTNIGAIKADGGLRSITLGKGVSFGADAPGEMAAGGVLTTLKVVDALKAKISATTIGSITAGSITQSSIAATGTIGAVKVNGKFHATLTGAALKSLSATSIEQSFIAVDRAIGKISVGAVKALRPQASIIDSTILAGQNVAPFARINDVRGAGIGSVTVAGSLTNSKIAAAGDIGAVKIGSVGAGGASDSLIAAGVDAGDGQLGNGNETWNGIAKINSVSIAGAFLRSSLIAGINPGADFTFGTGDDFAALRDDDIRQTSSIGAVTLGSASAPGPAPFISPASAGGHQFAIESLSFKSVKIGKARALPGAVIDADGNGSPDPGEVVIRAVS